MSLSFFLIYLESKQQIRSYTAVVPFKIVLDSRPKLGKSFFPFSAEIACEQALHVWGGTYNVYMVHTGEYPSPFPG